MKTKPIETAPAPSPPALPGTAAGYRSIIVHTQVEQEQAAARLALAVQLAQIFGARLVGVGAEAYAPAVFSGVGRPDAPRKLLDDLRGRLQQAEEAFLTAGKAAPGGAAWIAEEMVPSEALTLHVRGGDLIVATRPARGETENVSPPVADLVMAAGAPVLLAPTACRPFEGRRAVIGWKDTREARRALGDAIPFLQRAEGVRLLAFRRAPDMGETAHGLQEVAERLQQHGVPSKISVERADAEAVAGLLEAAAEDMGADLVVVGACSRSSPMDHRNLGGVTRDLMAHSDKFVLFGR